jgi:spore maturation protein CgeB
LRLFLNNVLSKSTIKRVISFILLELGNRWIQSLWTVTPHNNPPLDLSELEKGIKTYKSDTHEVVQYHQEEIERGTQQPQQYMELQKRESDI